MTERSETMPTRMSGDGSVDERVARETSSLITTSLFDRLEAARCPDDVDSFASASCNDHHHRNTIAGKGLDDDNASLEAAFTDLQKLHAESIANHRKQRRRYEDAIAKLRTEHAAQLNESRSKMAALQEQCEKQVQEARGARVNIEQEIRQLRNKVKEDALALIEGEREAWRAVTDGHRREVQQIEQQLKESKEREEQWKQRYEEVRSSKDISVFVCTIVAFSCSLFLSRKILRLFLR